MTTTPPPEAPPSDSVLRAWRQPLLLFALALGIRLLWLALIAPSHLVADEVDYHRRAMLHAEGLVNVMKYPGARAPVTEFVYGWLYDLFGANHQIARAWNALIGALLVLPVHAIARRLAGRRAALLAGLGVALFPELVFFSTALWSEPTYLLASTTGLALLLRASSRARSALLAGALFGLAALTREVGVVVPLALAPVVVWTSRPAWSRGVARALALLLGFVVVLSPWSLYATGVNGERVIVTTTSWYNAYIGNAPDREIAEMTYEKLGTSPSEREKNARILTIRNVRNAMPEWPFVKLARVAPQILSPNSFAVNRLMDPTEHARATFTWKALDAGAVRTTLGLLGMLITVAVLTAGGGAVGLVRDPAARWFLAVIVLAHWVGPWFTFGLSRFRLAFVPALLIALACIAVEPRAAWRDASRFRQIAVGVLAVVVLLVGLVQLPALVSTPRWG